MSQVYEEDILNAGNNQVIISNDNAKVIIVPELGGRIADVQTKDGHPYLHRTYPNGVSFGPYTEYGGIEECIGSAPGALWNVRWRWDKKDGGVILECLSQKVLIRKFVSLDEADPIIKIDYSFLNFGDNLSKFTFGVHPEVCIGGALRDNQYHVPTAETRLVGGYTEPGFKNKVLPSEGWCAITCGEKVFGQMFPEGIIDVVEIYHPRVNTHVVLEPVIFSVGVSPDKYAGFTYMIYIGDGDAERIREIRAAREAEFSVKYEPFDKAEVSGDAMTELSEMARARAKDELGDRLGRGMKIGIAGPQILDVGAIVQKALENVPGIRAGFKPAPTTVEPEGTGRTEDLPPDVEINIEHLKGNITIHGWERPYVEYTDMRGNINQREGVVRLETTGDYALKIPRETHQINLNSLSGDIAIFDVSSSLKINGVKGRIDIVTAKVPDDGTLDVSLVKGDINLSIPGDSSCNISATSIGGGEITCDLPLQNEKRTRTQLTGVLNDGTSKIMLNTVKGKISVSQVKAGI